MRQAIGRVAGVAGALLAAAAVLLYASRLAPGAVPAVAVVAAVLLLSCAALSYRELAEITRRRSARQGANALLMTAFFVVIVVIVQAISLRNRHVFDLTRNARYTLAPQTVAVLESLDVDVDARAFFRQSSTRRATVEDLLRRYATHTSRLRYEMIDPDRSPLVAQQMEIRQEAVVVTSGDRRRVIDKVDEQALTNAIVQVSRDRYKAVYFVTGHDEKSIDSRDRDGYSEVRRGLESQGYQVRDVSLVGVDRVPDDCEALVVAGPRLDFVAGEAAIVDDYLRSGGSAMFLVEPRTELPNLEALLRRYDIILDPVVILDELVVVDSGERVFDATVAKVRRYEPHPITRDFNVITMYPMARPVRLDEDSLVIGTEAQYLGITDESAWGEVDMESFAVGTATRDGEDIAPPLPVSAVVTLDAPTGRGARTRVVVVGDSDFAANSYYGVLGNSDFFLNCINYLAADEDLISIRPRRGPGDRALISERQGRFVFATSIVLLPLSVVIIGTVVLVRRRRTT
jgi:ABC-type uncharacterized transport system involved in gliding motility auxiliary subunit